jgi:nucleoside-diphosphate-sugar epimerase
VRLIEEALVHNPHVLNQDFNIGPAQASTILDLAKLIWKEFGDGREFQFVSKFVAADTAKRREMNAEKIRKAVGWEAEMSLEEGIGILAEQMK